MHGLQSFVSTNSGERKSDSVLCTLSLQQQMLLTSAFSKQNSAISLEEWVLVSKLFTTATRKLTINKQHCFSLLVISSLDYLIVDPSN